MGCASSTPVQQNVHVHHAQGGGGGGGGGGGLGAATTTTSATYVAPPGPGPSHVPVARVVTTTTTTNGTTNGAAAYNDDDKSQLRVLSNPLDVVAYAENLGVAVPAYLADSAPPISPELVQLFERYEVPLGLVVKLRGVETYEEISLVFDDSGSMGSLTDSTYKDCTPYIASRAGDKNARVTRWLESEDRLHILWDMIRFLNRPPRVRVSFLNRAAVLELSRDAADPETGGHAAIARAFQDGPSGGTPLLAAWGRDLARTRGKRVMHFFATDGVPNGGRGEIDALSTLILTRDAPEAHPVTFISCSDVEDETGWLRDVDGACRRGGNTPAYVGEYDDFADEREQVVKAQGEVFCFTKGVYFICMLVGAINPTDLDILDERKPMAKDKLEELLGRPLADAEYRRYANQPHFFA